VRIRKLEKKDAPEVQKLIMKGFMKFVAPTLKKGGVEEFSKYNNLEKLYERLEDPERILYIAEEKYKIIGYIEARNFHMSLFFVDEKWMKKGIGKQLYKKVETIIKQKGYKYIKVNSALSAIPVYTKFGFKKITGIQEKNGVVYQPMRKYLT